MNVESFFNVGDGVFSFLPHSLIARASFSMSLVNVVTNKNGPIPSDTVHDTNMNTYVQTTYCIYTAIKNPNGFLQLNGNLCVAIDLEINDKSNNSMNKFQFTMSK